MGRLGLALVGLGLVACGGGKLPASPRSRFTAALTDTHFRVADHFRASIEMQVSGEPFAQLLGRSLAGYNRYSRVTDLYTDTVTGVVRPDPLGYSMAVESYEYSKQPMNDTSMESGAGLSLQFGPVTNPDGVTGEDAFVRLRDRLQTLAVASHAGGLAGNSLVITPPPTDNPLNVYGWPGFWPVFAEFQSFANDVKPAAGSTHGCALSAGYASTAAGALLVGDYECSYLSLNLLDREADVVKLLDPQALGYAAWKQGLWIINYWQSLHDAAGDAITDVDPADLPRVGQPGNTVVGHYANPGNPTLPSSIAGTAGTWLGDTDLEGWQGLTMLSELEDKSALLLTQLLSPDGATLGGFASTADAIGYGYTSPLRYWPAATKVTETGTAQPPAGSSWRLFPQPVGFAIQTATSRLGGLTALLGGFAEYFALTDAANGDVGGQASCRATFDGDPFAGDDGLPDGEESPHDRALAVLKVALVNLDRLHFDPAHAVLVDETDVQGGAVSRGTHVDTVEAAWSIVALRAALRSISSTLQLYSNDTPDTLGAPTALDAAPLPGGTTPLGARIGQLIRAQADFLVAHLVGADGAVVDGYDVAGGTADSAPTTLQAEASAIRGLLEAYLATSDNDYRLAAQRIYADLTNRFWNGELSVYRTVAGDDAMTWTPLGFGTLQGALRQYWKLVASQPGHEPEADELLARVVRMNKLVLNGWDDVNGDGVVQYPAECTGAGLQMGERALTGELSQPQDGPDRDHDCVREIAAAQAPAALAAAMTLRQR